MRAPSHLFMRSAGRLPTPIFRIGLVIAIGLGCAARGSRVPPLEPGANGGSVLQKRLGTSQCPNDIAADVDLSIRPPGRSSIRLAGGIRVSWPERVRLQLRFGPFTPIASMAVDGDSGWVSLPRMKGFWAGQTSTPDSPAWLARAFLGLVCPYPLIRTLQNPILTRDPDGWVLEGSIRTADSAWPADSDTIHSVRVRLSKDQERVQEVRLMDGRGRTVFRSVPSGSRRIGGARVPERIRLEIGEPPLLLDMRLMRMRDDPIQPAGLFRIVCPAGSRLVDERDIMEMLYSGGAQ
jgi:hypothetical protein